MVAGKAPLPAKYCSDIKHLEEWILQMDDYFTITQTRNKQQQLAYVVPCTTGEALEWSKANRYSYTTWEEVKDAIREYNRDHYEPGRAFQEICDLKQTGTVQKYLNDIDRLNVYAKMTDHHLINIILNGITPHLCQAMAYQKTSALTHPSGRRNSFILTSSPPSSRRRNKITEVRVRRRSVV